MLLPMGSQQGSEENNRISPFLNLKLFCLIKCLYRRALPLPPFSLVSLSLYSPRCSGTYCIDQAGPELRDASASASLGLKMGTTIPAVMEPNLFNLEDFRRHPCTGAGKTELVGWLKEHLAHNHEDQSSNPSISQDS